VLFQASDRAAGAGSAYAIDGSMLKNTETGSRVSLLYSGTSLLSARPVHPINACGIPGLPGPTRAEGDGADDAQ
jgi:hypothetical protein